MKQGYLFKKNDKRTFKIVDKKTGKVVHLSNNAEKASKFLGKEQTFIKRTITYGMYARHRHTKYNIYINDELWQPETWGVLNWLDDIEVGYDFKVGLKKQSGLIMTVYIKITEIKKDHEHNVWRVYGDLEISNGKKTRYFMYLGSKEKKHIKCFNKKFKSGVLTKINDLI